VEDFLGSNYGKAVVSNAAMQMLLKQSPTAIDKLQQVFYLTDGEKQFLLSAGIGEGIFFAGANHVALQVVASQTEYDLINTNPSETFKQQAQQPESTQQTPQEPQGLPNQDMFDTSKTSTGGITNTENTAVTSSFDERLAAVAGEQTNASTPATISNAALQNGTIGKENNSLNTSL
jgi:hypothetical protein